jgi:hypothetical protein
MAGTNIQDDGDAVGAKTPFRFSIETQAILNDTDFENDIGDEDQGPGNWELRNAAPRNSISTPLGRDRGKTPIKIKQHLIQVSRVLLNSSSPAASDLPLYYDLPVLLPPCATTSLCYYLPVLLKGTPEWSPGAMKRTDHFFAQPLHPHLQTPPHAYAGRRIL